MQLTDQGGFSVSLCHSRCVHSGAKVSGVGFGEAIRYLQAKPINGQPCEADAGRGVKDNAYICR